MAKLTLKLNSSDLARIKSKSATLEKILVQKEGPVFTYVMTIANGYTEAVVSGMGRTIDGMLTLKTFLNSAVSVKWKPNAPSTRKLKDSMGWSLEVWKASGATEKSVKVYSSSSSKSLEVFSGIDKADYPAEYDKALRTEFGGISHPGEKPFSGRALFTLLNVIFAQNSKAIMSEIHKAINESIEKVGWGKS